MVLTTSAPFSLSPSQRVLMSNHTRYSSQPTIQPSIANNMSEDDDNIEVSDVSKDDLEEDDSVGSGRQDDNAIDGGDKHHSSYLEDGDIMANIKFEMMNGDKAGSKWLVMDDIFIMHVKQCSKNETFWDCSGRRHFNCPFKCSTFEDDCGNLRLGFMYKQELHICGQNKLGPIMHKFRMRLKEEMSTNYKAKFSKVFQQERKRLLEIYKDNPDISERIVSECIRDKRNFRIMAERAKNKCFPKVPKSHKEIDLSKINLQHLELERSSHPNPEVHDKDIILLRTPITAEAWAKSEYKSGDGTFKITPKLFYQVHN